MTVAFRIETVVDAPLEVVFDLARDVGAHTASMTKSKEQATGGVTFGHLELGDDVTWRARHFGLPFTMTSRVVEFDRPNSFVDEQTRGPFKRFRHVHLFSRDDDRTLMVDEVEFQSPLGPIGRLVDRMVLGRYMRQLLDDRARFLKQTAEDR